MPEYLMYLALFVVYAIIDGLYTYWMYMVQAHEPLRAGITAGLLMFLIGFGTISYTSNYYYLLPVSLGAAFGTWLVVYWKSNRNSSK